MPPVAGDPVARFWSKVERTSGCWLWRGTIGSRGYGMLRVRLAPGVHTNALAHRFAYQTLVGPIPGDLTIDHLCRVRRCVNPAHMEPVTRGENVLRGDTIPARLSKQTHCKRGHPLSGPNLYVKNGRFRVCVVCRNDYHRARRAAGFPD